MANPGRPESISLSEGGEKAFKALFDSLYLKLVRLAVSYTLDMDAAEDIVQEIFLRLWNNRKRMEHGDNLEGYLAAGVRNRCINWLEHRRVKEKYVLNYVVEEVDNDHEDRERFVALIRDLFSQLPEKRREVLRLNVFEKKSYAEVAEMLDISVNTVKDHIKKAYSFLRQEAGGLMR